MGFKSYFSALVLILLSIECVSADCDENSNWMKKQELDPNGVITIKWNVSDVNITMMIVGKTEGWIGIGFSPSGKLDDADLVIGWIENGKPHLEERHVTSNRSLLLNEIQSYSLLNGYEKDNGTVICWTRKLISCKDEDVQFTNKVIGVIWVWSEDDAMEPTINTSQYGIRNLNLLNVKAFYLAESDDIDTLDIRNPNITVPNDTNPLEWCSYMKVPKMNTKHHMIGFEPNLQAGSEDLLQCFILFECPFAAVDAIFDSLDPIGFNCRDPKMTNLTNLCSTMRVVWSGDQQAEYYPAEAGFQFGTPERATYYFLRTLMKIKPKHRGIVDNSGIKVVLTHSIRKHDAGILFVGSKVSPFHIIPPHQKNFTTVGICSTDCTEQVFPSDGINVFSIFFHSHLAGRKVVLRRFRDGVELEPLTDDHFHFDYQHPVHLKDALKILPKDLLVVECLYDTSDRENTTLGGDSFTDEMCLVFLNYYPLVNLSNCLSSLQEQEIYNLTGITASESGAVTKEPTNYSNASVKDYLRTYNWSGPQIVDLQNLNYNSDHEVTCLKEDLSMLHPDKNTTRFPKDAKLYSKDKC